MSWRRRPRDDEEIHTVVAMPRTSGNPYTELLASALEQEGLTVREWALSRSSRYRSGTVVHLHWPGTALDRRGWFLGSIGAFSRLGAVAVSRALGATIVLTTHNVRNHGGRHPRTEALFSRVLHRLLDGWIAPSETSKKAASQRDARLRQLPVAVIPLGRYPTRTSGHVASTTSTTRVLMFGRLEPYKNPLALVSAFHAMPSATAELRLLGECEGDLRRQLIAAASTDRRIAVDLRRISDEELGDELSRASLVVVPYTSILNSSTAIMALSYDVPVLVPAVGSMPELAESFGTDRVICYEEELTADVLAGALALAGRRPSAMQWPDDHTWPRIARRTKAHYEAARSHRGHPKRTVTSGSRHGSSS